MTIKELMEELKKFDENMEVQIVDGDWNEPINDIDEYRGIVLIRNID